MDNEIQLEFVAKSFDEVKNSLKEVNEKISETDEHLKVLEKTSKSLGDNASESMKEASLEIENMGKKASLSLKKMNVFSDLASSFIGTKRVVQTLSAQFLDLVGFAVGYSEELNLFNVVFKNNMTDIKTEFSEVGLEAERFQQKLHEAFGTNLQETRRFQALYQSMGENMGIVTEKAELMSSNLEKLTYDIASLYNASEEDVGQAIRAGVYAGQTKPLRRFGIDVTQVSMQPIMDELGIEKSISELSQAEKQLLRYMSVMRQSSVTHGDFANTIESPANQLKIFKQQCIEARIALGNLFIGAYAKILPYANAIIMVIKEVARAIASFFGIKVKDFNSGISTSVNEFNDLDDSIGGVGDSAGQATKAVKALKLETLSFDQIHNLTSPTPTGGSSGGGGGGIGSEIGGIDQRLLDALKGYENGMEKVRMKANEIRDKIMDWLGFTKEIDPLTGEVSWKFEGIGKTIKSLLKHFGELSATGKIIMGLGIGAGALTLVAIGGKLISVFGKTGLGRAITALIAPTTSLFKLIAKNNGDLTKGVTEWQKYNGMLTRSGKEVTGLVGVLTKLKGILAGSLLAIGGMAVYYDSFKSLREEGANLANVLGSIGGAIATIGGAMTVGATVAGPYGALIGGIAGALVLLFETMTVASDKYPQFTKALEDNKKATRELNESYYGQIEAIEKGVQTNEAQINSDKKLMEELKAITDENGRVKSGYEDRANFILGRMKDAYGVEYSMIDGVIQNYESVVKSIYDVINAKKAQIYFNAYEKEYEESVLASAKAEEQLKDKVKDRNGVLSELAELQDRANYLTEYNKAITKQLSEEGIDPLSKRYRDLSKELKDNYKELEANSAKQTDLNDKIKGFTKDIEEQTKTYIDATNRQKTYSDMWVAQEAGNWAEVERLYKEGSKKTTTDFTNSLIEQANAVQSGNPIPSNIIEGFRVLAVNSNKKYKEALSELPKETATQIDNAVKETDKKKKSVYGKSFELGEQTKTGYNTATKGLADEATKKFTGQLTSKENSKKFNEAGQKAGKEVISGIQKETNKGVDVKVKPNTNGVTSNVKSAVNNWGNGYTVDLHPKIKGNTQFTITQVKALGGVFEGGMWKNIKQYASGGLPSHGTMFTAGERGPEIVGHIGSRTEVLNQSQLASVMYEAVTKAISNSNLGGAVELIAHTDEGVVIDRINRITRKTGQCPIEV